MIKVYMQFDELSAADKFMFDSLFPLSIDEAKIFAVGSYNDLYDLGRLFEHSNYDIVIKYNSDDFSFEQAPEFYAILVRF